MAQSSIRKGFFFYFGLFILLLVSVFLVCLVIMMFNPGKTVLWMKYFSGKQEVAVAQTTPATEGGAQINVDYSTLTEIEINCDYANVTVQKNKEYKDDGIIIRNYAKGFVGAKKYNTFSYKVSLEGSKLTIDLDEPNGFLFFSKDIEVIINDSTTANKINLNNIALKVNSTGKSNIYLGGTTNKEEENVGLRSLDVSTSKGTITIGRKFDCSSITSTIGTQEEDNFGIRLYTGTGSIKGVNTIVYGTHSGSGIRQTNQNVSLGTNKGRINFGIVDLGANKLEIKCKKGTVAIDRIYAGGVEVNNCINGNYKFKTVSCDMNFNKSGDTIVSPIVNIDDIAGEFRMQVNGSKDAPIVNIKNAQQRVAVSAGKGSVTIGNAKGIIDLNSDTSMAVKVTVDKDNSDTIRISNAKGKINLKFLGAVSTNAQIVSSTSTVNISFTINATFSANCYKKDGTTPMASSNVNVNIGKTGVNYDYDKVNGIVSFMGNTTRGSISICTNGKANFTLVSAS